MISFHYEMDFLLNDEQEVSNWLSMIISSEGFKEGEINYIFCSDEYLYEINLQYLNHDTYTDIISFDYSVGKELHGDIYISIDRVKENAMSFGATFENELSRVLSHGILHYCGYKDKTKDDTKTMRSKENEYLAKRF